MSGIAGIVHLDRRPVDQDQLARMLANMSHRGPDGSGVWVNKHVGLGHLMFHETPESLSEQQPCANSQSGLTITADARIDNREELAGKLELNPAQAREYADSRYILLSYAKWGEDCVHELLGDFAFAIWDGRRQALFCARDCMGLKPFYYSHKQGRFIFASELRAVTSLKDVDKSINEEKIAAHMLFDSLDKESTIYTDFFRLPPAHTLRIDSKGFQKQHYWKPDVDTELKLGSNEEYAEAFRDVFSDSVQCRLRSAFPVGSMFSGGMDSSSMTGVARELLREKATDEKLRTFSATFPHLPGSNEEHFQDELIAGGDLEAFKVSMEGHSPLRLFLDAKGQLDSYPMYGWSYYIHRLLHEKMVDEGVRVSLDGFAGDDVVNHGVGYLSELFGNFRFLKAYREASELARMQGYRARSVFWHMAAEPNVPESLMDILRKIRHPRRKKETPAEELLRKHPVNIDFIKGTDYWKDEILSAKDEKEDLRTRHGEALTGRTMISSLELLESWSSSHGIATRCPFLDKRLVEFCVSLPHEQKINNGWTRIILRRAMANVLPGKNQWREKKAGNSPHLDLTMQGEDYPLVEKIVYDCALRNPRYFNVPKLRSYCNMLKSGNHYRSILLYLWSAVSLYCFFDEAVNDYKADVA